MKRLLLFFGTVFLLSSLSVACAWNESSREECAALLARSGQTLPPAVAERFSERGESIGGLPVSSLSEHEEVELSYFDDAAIFGHSHTVGMSMTLGLDRTDYYSVTGMTAPLFLYYREFLLPDGRYGRYTDALLQKDYEKIYIMLGTNDMPGMENGLFTYVSSMREILTNFRALQPNAKIYLLSIAPVGQNYGFFGNKDAKDSILLYSRALKSLSRDFSMPYIDIHRPMCAEDGYAKADIVVKDGLHFNSAGYRLVLEAMRTHTY